MALKKLKPAAKTNGTSMPVLTQNSCQRRTKHKAQAKRHSEKPHSFGAIFPRGHIRDISLCGRKVCARDSAQNSSGINHPQCARKTNHQVANARTDNAEK